MVKMEDGMKKKRPKKEYSQIRFYRKFFYFNYVLFKDLIHILKYGREFNEYGLTMFCGRQGGGKTIAMVEYLERIRKKYPKCLIVTNFGYVYEDYPMNDWKDFYTIRNGTDGVIFAIDEIQNEFSSTAWKTFPESLLSEITQQRKQRVKIVATSQVFTRVVKSLREQTYEVVECVTIGNRWTFTKAFDAADYNSVVEDPDKKNKLRRLYRKNFVQDKKIRELFDSYAKIEKMKKTDFIPRNERVYE